MSVLQLTDQNFQTEVLNYQGIVLVDFWAPWCGPCQVMGPIVEELAGEYRGKVKMGKLNIDENPKTTTSFQVMSIPTLVFFKNGRVIEQVVGIQAKEVLKLKLDSLF